MKRAQQSQNPNPMPTIAHFLFLNINDKGKLLGPAEGMDAPSKLKVFLYREKERLEFDARAEGVKGGASWSELEQGWQADLERFRERRRSYLLYPE